MNYLLVLPFLFLLQFCIAQENKDYVIDNSGLKVYGDIKNATPTSLSSQITFNAPNISTKIYYPTTVREWSLGGNVYESKTYAVGDKNVFHVFMQRISDNRGPVRAYEYYNSMGEHAYTQTFLEKDSVLTEVLYGRFKKQMLEYFSDQTDMVDFIKNGRIRKKDLLILVDHYNQIVADQTPEETPTDTVAPLLVIRSNRTLEKDQPQSFWELDDLLLSPEAAAKKYREHLEIATQKITNPIAKEIEINSQLGRSFFEQKQYDAAIPYLKQAQQAIVNSQKGQAQKPRLETMLATIYLNQHKYGLAIGYNSTALEQWKNGITKSADTEFAYQAYLNQGKLLQNLSAAPTNTVWYKQSVPEEEQDWEVMLQQQALSPIVHSTKAKKSTDFNLALLLFKRAEKLLPELEDPTSKAIEIKLAIGALFFEAGDYQKAKEYYQEALGLMEQTSKEEHPQWASTKRILSEISLANQLYDEALTYIDQAQYANFGEEIDIDYSLLQNINKIPFPFELLNSITTKGIILYQKNLKNPSEKELKKVLAHYAFATKLLHQLRTTHRNEGSNHRLANVTHKFSQYGVIICNTLFELTQKETYLHEAFRYAELSKSAVLYETVNGLKSMEVANIPRAEMIKENGLKAQIAYLKGEIFYELQQGMKKDRKRLAALQEKVTAISKEHNDLLKEFEVKYPKYYALKYNYKLISIEELQQKLAPNEVFLEYIMTDSFVYVLAIGKNELKSQFTASKESLSTMIDNLQQSLKNNRPNLYERYGQELYKYVIGDLAPFLQDKKLIIAPDDELHYIPFGVLPLPNDVSQHKGSNVYGALRFLIEEHPICYNYSANFYILSKKQRPDFSGKKISTWAPNFDGMEEIIRDKGIGETLIPLPGAQKEATQIADMFGYDAFLNQDASEASFKNLADQYSVLHIATHGVLNDLDPLFSSLILTANEDEDGILHAFELYNMHLNADLAVLSACNSGMGKLTKGEGVVSIARGFSYAGVPNIVMSKWPVSDWSTSILMKYFYKNLKKGWSKDEALQQAKIQYLDENRDKGKVKLLAPFYWGAFVLSGDTTPIETLIGNDGYIYIGILIALIGLILLAWYWKRQSKAKPTT